ncbi:MAG: LPS export ABC transporter permease LptF [Acetobacteraceae bacterium]|nr:LPS export ABC transporter permease LptF [Acetobacteraceae bacterium]
MGALHITRLDRYVFRQLFVALLAVTLGLVALIWLTQSLRFVELVVNRGLSFTVFLKLTGLLIPGFVAVILPITCFVVVQFVYQRLAGDRELTVMRAAGLSPLALARPALAVVAVTMGVHYALNLWLVPASASSFREYQWEIRNHIAAFLLQEGVFTTVSDDLVVYVRAKSADGTLRGIMVDDARDRAHRATILAESGRLMEGATGPRVLLENGTRQEIDARTGQLNVLSFKENLVDLSAPAREAGARLRDAGEMGIADLFNPPAGVVNPRDIPKWRVEGHKRLTAPLSTMSFTMVALLAVLGGVFRRHGGLLRPFVAILSVVALVAVGLALDSLAVRMPGVIPLLWLRSLLPAAICAVVLFVPTRGERALAGRRAAPLAADAR